MKPYATAKHATERKLRICIIFDEATNLRDAVIMIGRVTSGYVYETESIHFDNLAEPAHGVAAARSACEMDILVLAIRDDQSLPTHVRLWFGLCLGLRDGDDDGALVALITQTDGSKDLDSSLVDYLEVSAIIGGLAFFAQRYKASDPCNRACAQRG